MSISVIKLGNKISFDNVVALRKQGDAQMVEGASFQVDFSDVQYYDSSILALLLAWKRVSQKKNMTLAFFHVPPSLKTLATVCNVQTILML